MTESRRRGSTSLNEAGRGAAHASVLISIALAACGREPASVTLEPAPTSARTLDPSKELAPLVARLTHEAASRASSALPADRVLDALHQADIPVLGRRQYLGVTVGASYCLGGATADGVAIAVCEYASPQAAIEGKAFMEARFATMTPTAKRAVRDATVITVVDAHESRSPRVGRALEVFAALSPQQTN